MPSSDTWFIGSVVIASAAAVVVALAWPNGDESTDGNDVTPPSVVDPTSAQAVEQARSRAVPVSHAPATTGGVASVTASQPPEQLPSEAYGGTTPPIADVTTPEVQYVIAAAQRGDPVPRTEMYTPKAFDLAAYQADPEAYLRRIEPGRIWQSATPGRDVPAIDIIGDSYFEVGQDEWITLTTQVPAASPVTFYSFDLGVFRNQLTTQTVAADDNGRAQVQFSAPPGTTGLVAIQAASPLASGYVMFTVEVIIPEAEASP